MGGNFQMYNLNNLPPSARPSTSAGPSGGMGNPQTGSNGQMNTQGQPMVLRIDDSSGESSGSGGQGRMDNNGYNEYGIQGSNSAGPSGLNYNSMNVNTGNGSMKPAGSAVPQATDMPAFSGGSFAMGGSAIPGGGSTVSGYQVGSSSVGSLEQSFGQIGQQGQSYLQQEMSNKAQGASGSGLGMGSSGTVDQESFEVCLWDDCDSYRR